VRNNRMKKRKPLHLVLDILIGILCVLTVGTAAFTIKMLNEDLNFSYDEESFYWRFQDEDYGQMVEMYHQNEAAGVKEDEELRQYYGIAKYYEAASYYRAYEESGNKEAANQYRAQMEEAENEMGELGFASETIKEKLQIR